MADLIPLRVLDALYGAVESAFATTAFLFAMQPMDDEGPLGMPSVTAVVHFDVQSETSSHGYVALRCPTAMLPMLTANILGDETNNSEGMQRDALGEITNVICGNVLPELFPSVSFRLQSPVVRNAEDPTVPSVDPATITLDIDGYRIDATLMMTGLDA